jgi:hypothetical protein
MISNDELTNACPLLSICEAETTNQQTNAESFETDLLPVSQTKGAETGLLQVSIPKGSDPGFLQTSFALGVAVGLLGQQRSHEK